jgi:hypothetical protein
MSSETAVASVTANGVTISSAMTPTERYNAIAKSMGAPTVERPVAPAQWHTPATVQTFMDQERNGKQAAAKAAPPAKAKQQSDPNAVAKFDEEMRQQGKQLPTQAQEQQFRKDSVAWLETWANGHDDEWIKKSEKKLREWAGQIEAGTHGVRLRPDGNGVDCFSRSEPTAAPGQQEAYDAALARAVAAQDAKGAVDSVNIDPVLLSGYTIPAGRVDGLQDLIDGLKLARKRGFSQSKVDQILKDNFK